MNALSANKIKYLLIALIFISCIYIFFCPLIVSIDSIEGFLTYKQPLHSISLLYFPEVSSSNVNLNHMRFSGYWSPGQWLYPGILNYLLHLKLGVASIIVTIVWVVTGMIGFYRVFGLFNFTREASLYSLFLIFSSYTFYYSFIVYQGGEILSFGIFPWFVYVVLSAKTPSLKNLMIIALLFFLCFLAKLTLLIYCPIVLAYKLADPIARRYLFHERKITVELNHWTYLLPVLILFPFIYYFYLRRYPLFHGHLDASVFDVLTPLASPLSSVLSLHQVAGSLHSALPALSVAVLYVCLLAAFLFLSYVILRDKRIDTSYKSFLLILYSAICFLFIFSYLFDRVDQSPRHFKFLGYLFLPGLITIANNYLKRIYVQLIVLFICLAGIVGLVYLKEDWIKGRFVSDNYFYRNYDNKDDVDRLDKESYRKLISIAKNAPDSSIFFIQANLDIAMDLPFRCIIPWKNLTHKYFNHGPIIFACLPQDTLRQYQGLLQQKFPDYSSFQLIDHTKTFVYYKCE